MNIIEWLIVAAIAGILGLVLYATATMPPRPNCTDRGGRMVFSHHMLVGKVLMPQYKCEVPK